MELMTMNIVFSCRGRGTSGELLFLEAGLAKQRTEATSQNAHFRAFLIMKKRGMYREECSRTPFLMILRGSDKWDLEFFRDFCIEEAREAVEIGGECQESDTRTQAQIFDSAMCARIQS